MHPYVERRPARPRPAPERGVRLRVLESEPAPAKRGWTNLHGEIVGEFGRLGLAPSRDELKHCRGERRIS